MARHRGRSRLAVSLLGATFLSVAGGPAFAGDLVPPKVLSVSPGGVSLANGIFVYSETDLSIGPLTLERNYRGGDLRDPNKMYFGYHMTHNFDIFVAKNYRAASPPLFAARYRPVVHLGNGSSGPYRETFSGTWSCCAPNTGDAGAGLLEKTSSSAPYKFTSQDGTIYNFNPAVTAGSEAGSGSQRIDNVLYPNGRAITFSYDGSGQLKLVVDNSGYALVFDYGTNGYVSQACGFNTAVNPVTLTSTCTGAALKVVYGYTTGTKPSISSVTNVLGQITTFTDVIGCITPPGYATCKVRNLPGLTADMVGRQEMIDGSVWQYGYDGDYGQIHDPEVPPEAVNTTQVIDPNGKFSTYYFWKTSPYYFVDNLGRQTDYVFEGGRDGDTITQPVPPEGGLLREVHSPDGSAYFQEPFGSYKSVSKRTWKATPGSPEASQDIVEQYGYAACSSFGSRPHPACTQPLWIKDGRLNQTDNTYDTVHGGILTATLPEDSSGNRTRTYTTYASFNTGSGTIYRPVRTETCSLTPAQLSLTACPALVTTSVTLTAYGDATNSPNTYKGFQPYQVTQTDGAGTLSATVTYNYDTYGNAIWTDGPLAGDIDRVFKTYDLKRRVVCEIGADPDGTGALVRAMTRHTYDAPGRETLTETGTGTSTTTCIGTAMTVAAFTRTTYDGMDRVTKTEVGVP